MKTCFEILFQILLTIGLADLVAGLVHWFEDAYVREDTPLIGSAVGRPNVIHHHLPRYFTRFSWWYSSRDLLVISGLIVLAAWSLGLLTWPVWLFAIISTNANEVHKWSHRTRLENGPLISRLQDLRILQTVRHHALHHTNPKNCHYCPLTNLLNPVLDRLQFWSALEWILARTIRLHRQPDTSLPPGAIPDWVEKLRHEKDPQKPAAVAAKPKTCDCAKCPVKNNPQTPCLARQRLKPAPAA
jgi:hypothetical protein